MTPAPFRAQLSAALGFPATFTPTDEQIIDAAKATAKRADDAGEVRRVFINSMWDPFEGAPLEGGSEGRVGPRHDYLEVLDDLAAVAADVPNLRLLVLTKRPWNAVHWWRNRKARGQAFPRWWVLASVENQETADERIPWLLQLPAEVLGLSMEPLLGAVNLTKLWCHNCETDDHVRFDPPAQPWCVECDSEVGPAGWLDPCADERQSGIRWVIVGGESGPKARPMHPAWARSLRDQCVWAGVPFFFKQWGEYAPVGDGRGNSVARVGKHAAGRLLDGCEWNEVPDV